MDVRPIVRRRLYQEVGDRIEEMIRSGNLSDGDALPSERELMERFAVGRPAIREALLSLQQKGLVTVTNGERARITHPDAGTLIGALSGAAHLFLSKPEGVAQFQAARRLFEAAIAREAAVLADDADRARIRAALDANRAARGDRGRFETTDVDFHLEIVRTIRNPLMSGVHQALSGWLTEQRRVSLTLPQAETEAFDAHVRICAAIVVNDGDGAASAMQAHLDTVAKFYWAAS